MTIPIVPDSERRTAYTLVSPTTGPLNCGFDIHADGTDYDAWVEVWDDNVRLTAVTDFVLDSPSGSLGTLARPITDARITFTASRSGNIQIVGARRPRRTTQFTAGVAVTADDFNRALSDIMAALRELSDEVDRSARSFPGEAGVVRSLESLNDAADYAQDAHDTLEGLLNVYAGGLPSDPLTRPDGSALTDGFSYFNTLFREWRAYDTDTSAWYAAGTYPGGASSLKRYRYVATASQTVFSGADTNLQTLAYAAGNIFVFLNGHLLDPTDEYTASNGTSVVLTVAADASDELQIFAFGSFSIDGNVSKAGDTMTGALTLPSILVGTNRLTVLNDGSPITAGVPIALPADPASALHAATKQYVDGLAVNVGKRARARAATTANITIATALNNADTLDGVTLATGDNVLVKNQSAPAENGIYVVGVTPARSAEFDTYNEHPGSLIAVEEGSTNADTLWLCTSNDGGTLNTTAIAFSKMVTAGELLAANNLSDLANATTARTNLGVAIGTDVQAYSASAGKIQIDTYTASSTWTKPSWATSVELILIAAGGGGGSGSRRAAQSGGGSGGAGGGIAFGVSVKASLLGATETVTVGAAGTGGAAVSANDTDGNDGVAGGDSSFGAGTTLVKVTGGAAGLKGTSAAGGATSTGGLSLLVAGQNGRNGGAGATTGAGSAGSGATVIATSAGGGGAGQAAVAASANGGASSVFDLLGVPSSAGGVGSTKTAAGAGTQVPMLHGMGSGGGGGWVNADGTAGAGGAAGGYGAGGGGGGGSNNGNNSGAGGAGAPGLVVVISRGN